MYVHVCRIIVFRSFTEITERTGAGTSVPRYVSLAHSQMRVGDVPGEYPSVCTGPYYRVQKKKKKKKYNAHYNAISFI